MKALQVIGSVAVIALVSGCTALTVGYDVERMRKAQGTGDAFTRALTDEYRQLTVFEADEMYDWTDASYYARKGQRAAAGETVQPQEMAERRLPAEHVGELTSTRGELVGLLDASARTKVPETAARAQANFDCWMEQQEENFQPDHIAACRDAFYLALQEMKTAMAPPAMAEPKPEPMPAPAPAVPQRFVVFFGFDSTRVTPAGTSVIRDALAAARTVGAGEFSVTGHADRAGPAEYNLGLSLRRANAVRDALVGGGVRADGIGVAGRGEAENAVPTADGVREPANRRVEIILLK